MTRNPVDDIDISFNKYVKERSYRLEKHMAGGVPDYAFATDYALRQKINAIPGAFRLFKILTTQIVPRERQKFNMFSTKVTPNQFPDIYKMTKECAETLGIGMPTVYIQPEAGVMNALAYATEDAEPLIVLYSALVERMEPDEIKSVIGHECGHIHNNHSIYNIMVNILLYGVAAGIPGVDQLIALMSLPLKTAILAWSRAAEVTCDRAGIICVGNAESTMRADAKLMSGGLLSDHQVNVQELIKQYESLRSTPVRFLEYLSTHPTGVRRILASQEFIRSEVFYKWHPELKEPGMKLYTKEELDNVCNKYVSVTKSEKRKR